MVFTMCCVDYACHQRRWEVNPAEGGDNWSRRHPLHWRRLWVRHLLPNQIPCGPTKGFHHSFVLLFTNTNANKSKSTPQFYILFSHQVLTANKTTIIITGLLQNNWKRISAIQPKPLQLWEGEDEFSKKASFLIWSSVPLFAWHLFFEKAFSNIFLRCASLCLAPGKELKGRLGTPRPRPSFKYSFQVFFISKPMI